MELVLSTEDEKKKTYFINTAVDEKTFKEVKSKAHKKEITRSDYIRGLINEDLKDESKQ